MQTNLVKHRKELSTCINEFIYAGKSQTEFPRKLGKGGVSGVASFITTDEQLQ